MRPGLCLSWEEDERSRNWQVRCGTIWKVMCIMPPTAIVDSSGDTVPF